MFFCLLHLFHILQHAAGCKRKYRRCNNSSSSPRCWAARVCACPLSGRYLITRNWKFNNNLISHASAAYGLKAEQPVVRMQLHEVVYIVWQKCSWRLTRADKIDWNLNIRISSIYSRTCNIMLSMTKYYFSYHLIFIVKPEFGIKGVELIC